MPMEGKLFLLLISLLLIGCKSLSINMITGNGDLVGMYNNNLYNRLFIRQNIDFNCSMDSLYSYSQSLYEYLNNTGYTIQMSNFGSSINFSLTTKHNHFTPSLSASFCSSSAGSSCIITLFNNCPTVLGQFNYFDVL